MIEKFEIEYFRAIKKIKLQNLSKINIFVGRVNIGKTSILEAFYLYLSQYSGSVINIANFRQIIRHDDCFKGMFYNYQTSNQIILKGIFHKNTHKNEMELKISFSTDGTEQKITLKDSKSLLTNTDSIILQYKNSKRFEKIQIIRSNLETQFESRVEFQRKIEQQSSGINDIDDIAEFIYENQQILKDNLKNILSNVQKKNKIREHLKNFSEHIRDISFIGNTIMIEKDNLDNLLNLKLMGAGFKKYLSIMLSILNNKQYILIDEIENGLHFDDMELLFNSILDSAPDIQFFITTHNQELMSHLNQLLKRREEKGRELSVFNVYEDKNGDVKILEYSQDDFMFNMSKNNEMRD